MLEVKSEIKKYFPYNKTVPLSMDFDIILHVLPVGTKHLLAHKMFYQIERA